MALLARKRRVAVDRRIEVSSHDMLDLSSCLDVLRFGVWKLDPIGK
jgi:hypothetical protein